MKRYVVEDTADAVSLEIADQGIPFGEASEANVEHVAVVRDVVGHRWPSQHAACLEVRKAVVVGVPRGDPVVGDALGVLKLCEKEGSDDLSRKVAGSEIAPGVLVDLPPEKPGAVRSLFTVDFAAFDEVEPVHQEGTALAGDDVLRFMEAQATEVADRTKGASPVACEHALRRVLHDRKAMLDGDGCNVVHFAGDARVVDGDNCACSRGQCVLDETFVDI